MEAGLPISQPINPRLFEQLLASNDVPHPDVDAKLQEYAASLTVTRLGLREELRDAQDLVETLTRQNASIDKKLQAVKIVLSRVRAIPADVLRVICSFLIPTPSEIISFGNTYLYSPPTSVVFEATTAIRNWLNPRNSIWAMTQVCQSWRNTLLQSPSLWSTISVRLQARDDRERSIYGQLFLLQLCLQRAKNLPLTLLCWTMDSDISPYHPLLAVLSSYLQRVRILVTKLPPAVTQNFFLTGSIVNVEQLISNIDTDSFARRTFDFTLCRKLWSIYIKFAGLPGNSGETNTYLLPKTVTYYRGLLVTEWSDLQSLANLPHLQILSLVATNWDGALANMPYLHLPALTRMYIELDMFGPNAVGPILQYIKAPRLETLTIFADNEVVWRDLLSSGERTPTVSTVKTLHLMSPDMTWLESMSFLVSFPNVERLMIASPKLDGDLVSWLKLDVSANIPLLPRLQSLKLVEYAAEADIGASIIAVAESRRRDGNDSALHEVVLAHELDVDEEWQERWETLQRDGLAIEYGAINDVEKHIC